MLVLRGEMAESHGLPDRREGLLSTHKRRDITLTRMGSRDRESCVC
jgi:hypothetical protein